MNYQVVTQCVQSVQSVVFYGNYVTGCPANFSDWIEGRNLTGIKVMEGDKVIGWDNIIQEEGNEANMSFRVEIHVASVKSALMYLTYVPLSLEMLTKKCEAWEVDLNSERIPVAVLAVGKAPDHKKGGGCTDLMVKEKENMKCGFGIFPLIEQVNPWYNLF